jgi:hypothetical protein
MQSVREGIDDAKADVVARVLVPGAGVAEADDEARGGHRLETKRVSKKRRATTTVALQG